MMANQHHADVGRYGDALADGSTIFALCDHGILAGTKVSDTFLLDQIIHLHNVEQLSDYDHASGNGCVIVDADRDSEAALALLKLLRPVLHVRPVIVLTNGANIRTTVSVMRAGAYDVLEKPVDSQQLQICIRAALASAHPADAPVRSFAPRLPREAAQAAVNSLTQRQCDILWRIVEGQPNKNIAADLGISQRTAENHRAAIMRKLHVSSISGLVQVALAASGG
jgi:FixJ family two-component response regulator